MAAKRRGDLRVVGARPRGRSGTAPPGSCAGRRPPSRPYCGRARHCFGLRHPMARIPRCNAVDHPCSTSTRAGGVSGTDGCVIERAQARRAGFRSAAAVAAASWLVAEHLSRGEDVTQRHGSWQPHNDAVFPYVNSVTYKNFGQMIGVARESGPARLRRSRRVSGRFIPIPAPTRPRTP